MKDTNILKQGHAFGLLAFCKLFCYILFDVSGIRFVPFGSPKIGINWLKHTVRATVSWAGAVCPCGKLTAKLYSLLVHYPASLKAVCRYCKEEQNDGKGIREKWHSGLNRILTQYEPFFLFRL